MPSGVLTIAEATADGLKKSALEMVSAGRELAGKLGVPFAAAVVGSGVRPAAEELAKHGVEKVYLIDDEALAGAPAESFGVAIGNVVDTVDPEAIILAASIRGRDLGPALAGRLKAAIITDAIGLDVVDGAIRAVRPVYADKVRLTVEPVEKPIVLSIRPKSFAPAEETGDAGEVVPLAYDAAGMAARTVVKELLGSGAGAIDLTEADVIVSGGRGMKGPENFSMLGELAEALGGVVGASRAVVDAGWRPHSEQVGQTGKTVCPKLYVACGISGAIQHLAGMTSSDCIVAVNKDPEAPIFKVADYGIVGDVMEVVPALTGAVREVRS